MQQAASRTASGTSQASCSPATSSDLDYLIAAVEPVSTAAMCSDLQLGTVGGAAAVGACGRCQAGGAAVAALTARALRMSSQRPGVAAAGQVEAAPGLGA